MPITKDREYRAIMTPITIPAEKKRINSDYYVEGMAAIFNKPYELFEFDGVKYYEEIDSRALDGADLSDVIMQYDHQGRVLARNSNSTLGIEPNEKGLFIYADLSKSEDAKRMYQEIVNGLVTKMSWAFTVAEDKFNKETRTRTITRVKKVYDVSAVSIPANNDTEISARSYFDGVIEAERQELLERRKRRLRLLIELEGF